MPKPPKDKRCQIAKCFRQAIKNIRFNKKTIRVCKECSERSDGIYFENGQSYRE